MAWRRALLTMPMLMAVSAGYAAEEPLPCPSLCRMWMGSAAPPLPGDDAAKAAAPEPGPALRLQGAIVEVAATMSRPVPPVPVARPAMSSVANTRALVPLPPRRPVASRPQPVRTASASRAVPVPPVVTPATGQPGRPDHAFAAPGPVAAEVVASRSLPPSPARPEPDPAGKVDVVLPAPPAPPALMVMADAIPVVLPDRVVPPPSPPRQVLVWPPGLDVIASVMLSSRPR